MVARASRSRLILLGALVGGLIVAIAVLRQRHCGHDDLDAAKARTGTDYAIRASMKQPQRLGTRLRWMVGDLQPVRVAGVVLNGGSPQPGASVELHSWTTAARARDVDRVTTDAEGRFDLGYQDAAMSLILARHEGAEASQRFDFADPGMQRSAEQIVLELEPCDRFVRGRIVDDGRHPLANIELHLVRNVGEMALIPIGRSTSDGTFSVCASGEVAAGGGDLGLAMLPMREDVAMSCSFLR